MVPGHSGKQSDREPEGPVVRIPPWNLANAINAL